MKIFLLDAMQHKDNILRVLTFVAGECERALLELIGVCVDAGAVLQEYPGHLYVTSAGCLH